jgi:two-component system, chemotaxis family, protein-glutamate methylesterase/glutaminase
MESLPERVEARSRPFPRAAFDLVVIAASAGGVRAIRDLLAALPATFPTPIVLVQHLSGRCSAMAEVLGWGARLSIGFARAGDRLRAGKVFVAPPDQHLLIGENRRLLLESSDKVNWVRPAADPLFTSAAQQFGPRLLAIVLTGMGKDGAAGAMLVKRHRGFVIVQDPSGAEADAMPRATLITGAADLILPLEAIPRALIALCDVMGTRELLFGTTIVAA